MADFATWFRQNLADVKHFSAAEFLVKGAAHANNGLNTDPPRDLWPNIAPTARVLEALRVRIGKPVIIHSAYRSPAYNASIGGAADSQHMKFRACDITVADPNSGPADWWATLKAMRADGLFEGGIGVYDTFVHVDTRGTRADWDERRGAKTPGMIILGPSTTPPPDYAPPTEQPQRWTLIGFIIELFRRLFSR